ncbi:MAG: choice-of-anchor D domain-containing protein, partial [bacterium]
MTTSDNGAIAVGKTHSFTFNNSADVLAIRVDGNGDILWNGVFNGIYLTDGWWDAAHDIISLSDGSVMLTGYAYMDTNYDLLLLTLDAGTGTTMFNETYGEASASDKGQSLVETPSGEIVIAGTVGGASGVRALFTKMDALRDVAFANVLGPAASASEFTANILDVASYFVSGYSLGYVPNGEALGVRINNQGAITSCAEITAVTFNRRPGVTRRFASMITTNFSATPNSHFLNSGAVTTTTTTVCSDETVGPDITATPPFHNYGTVLVGQQADKVFRVQNDGNANLVLGTVTNPSGAFSKITDNCSNQTLPPTAFCEVTTRFAPTTEGVQNNSFLIPSNDADENPVTVSLQGTGIATTPDITVNPTDWTYGNVNVGASVDKVIQVRNDGNVNLVLGAVTSPSAPFSKVSDACSNQTLTPTQTCDITARFAPTSAGPFNGNFAIPSNDPDEPNTAVTLTGTGVAPEIEVTPNLLNFGAVL